MFIFTLTGCGSRSRAASTQLVQGNGYEVSVPRAWSTTLRSNGVTARSGGATVSVTRFRLQRAYDSSMFAAAVPQLDRVAVGLAADEGATLTSRTTERVAGRRSRVYRYRDTKIGFVLVGRYEYQLLCRSGGGGDPGRACALLFSSFDIA